MRLERVLLVYRTWINVEGVEGGFALTQDELECVLEYPPATHVEFLLSVFRTKETNRVDLITLLATLAVFASGSIEDKCRLLFRLVDFDTEDEIAESELALVVSAISDGLQRLHVDSAKALELDALAVAYEAFDFTEVEDGSKMTLAQFIKWVMFHPWPRALFDRISVMFSASFLISRMSGVLLQYRHDLAHNAFVQFNDQFFRPDTPAIAAVALVVGPIVGKVRRSVRAASDVRGFALVVGVSMEHAKQSTLAVVVETVAYSPCVVVFHDLEPSTTYTFRFLGIRQQDRESCVAAVTTCSETQPTNIRTLTHTPDFRTLRFRDEVVSKILADTHASCPAPTLSIHFDCIQFPPDKCYRDALREPKLASLLRLTSNLLVCPSECILFGGSDNQKLRDHANAPSLLRLAQVHWQNYIARPLFSPTASPDESFDKQWHALEDAITWKLAQLSRNACFLTSLDSFGCESTVSIKSTTVHIPQVLCGPLYREKPSPTAERIPPNSLHPRVQVDHGHPELAAHLMRLDYDGDRMHHQVTVIEPVVRPNLVVGPVIGFVSHDAAKILIECDGNAIASCVLIDRLTAEKHVVHSRVYAFQPKRFLIRHLLPGRTYDVNFEGVTSDVIGVVQTLHRQFPALRLVTIGDDLSLNSSLALTVQQPTLVGECLAGVISNFLPSTQVLSADVVLRLGSIVSLAHEWNSLILECMRQGDQLNRFRQCVRDHWMLPENRVLLARASHIFLSLGTLRAIAGQLEGVTLSTLRGMQRVLNDYEDVGKGWCAGTADTHDLERYVHRIQDVTLVVLDTFEEVLRSEHTCFTHQQERALSPSQWQMLVSVLQTQSTGDPGGSSACILLGCDIPLVTLQPTPSNQSAFAWDQHPEELEKLLSLICGKISKVLKNAHGFGITGCSGSDGRMQDNTQVFFLASDSTSSCIAIRDDSCNVTFTQITIGAMATDGQPTNGSTFKQVPTEGFLIGNRYSWKLLSTIPDMSNSAQFGILDVVPHRLKANVNAEFYVHGKPQSRLLVGPVVGRVTTRTARILVEVDRDVQNATCVLMDLTTSERHTGESSLEAHIPTIFKVEGLRPGARYSISFEGLMSSQKGILGIVETPPLLPLTSEWLVVSHNLLSKLHNTTQPSHWKRILRNGMHTFSAQAAAAASAANSDLLGEAADVFSSNYNPWFHVKDAFLSEPMKNPSLLVHLGGQLDMRTAFTEEELIALVRRLGDKMNDEKHVDAIIIPEVRFRLQEVYRIAWGVPPMEQMLRYSGNIMLLQEGTDIYFSKSRIDQVFKRHGASEVGSDALEFAARTLRSVAFELWQRYQNQLWVDLNESDYLLNKNSKKMATTLALGICELVFVNVTNEFHDWKNSHPKQPGKSAKSDKASLSDADNHINLFSHASWTTLEEATSEQGSPIHKDESGKKNHRAAKSKREVQQLIIFLPIDLVDLAISYLQVRKEITRLLETISAWKAAKRKQRDIAIVCSSDSTTSMTFEVTDDKLNISFPMSCIGSISEQRVLSRAGNSKANSTALKGHFSKRFTYASTFQLPQAAQANEETLLPYRGYASYQYVTDYRRGFLNENLLFFPPKVSPKATLGPVVGRIFSYPIEEDLGTDQPFGSMRMAVSILLEINAQAKVTCVLTNALTAAENRVVKEMKPEQPAIFHFTGLMPESRYVFKFEGISNAEMRKGSLHTSAAEPTGFNFVAISSNFPTQMDPGVDSLWVALLMRMKLPWCGVDAVIHLGGQVPLQEAAVDCYRWARKALKNQSLGSDDDAMATLKLKIRKRFQQHYRVAWNIPNVRELLACSSNWFLKSQADIAPFLRSYVPLRTRAAEIVLEIAQKVLQEYQLALMDPHPDKDQEITAGSGTDATKALNAAPEQKVIQEPAAVAASSESKAEAPASPTPPTNKLAQGETSPQPVNVADPPPPLQSSPPPSDGASVVADGAKVEVSSPTVDASSPAEPTATAAEADATAPDEAAEDQPSERKEEETREDEPADDAQSLGFTDGATSLYIAGAVGVFMCDMRNVKDDDVITCNDRLTRPLSYTEHPIIGEKQWQDIERALRKKKLLAFILCFELPLILTNAVHADKLRDEANSQEFELDEERETWRCYDYQQLFQHWIACKRQLEQLLNILFRWKAKRSGRDVVVLSGGMRVGLETVLQDCDTHLSIRNFTAGPITATVEPFELPVDGIACPTFAGGIKDDRFTFAHTLIATKNYALGQVHIVAEKITTDGDGEHTAETEVHSANITVEFVPDNARDIAKLHPVAKLRRYPSWWAQYVPMGRNVFWDDTITLKCQTDDDMVALREFVDSDRTFRAALDVLYEKYQFAETARLEELRSQHVLEHFDLREKFATMTRELWRVLPEAKRQRCAYFLDSFVCEFLFEQVTPTELLQPTTTGPVPIELAQFCSLVADFVFYAGVLHLVMTTRQQDDKRERIHAREAEKQRAIEAAAEQARLEAQRLEEAKELEILRQTDPEEYAKIMLAKEEAVRQEKEAKHKAKLDLKKAERVREAEEERAIAKEQKRLNKLAESNPEEYARRLKQLEGRMRRLDEKRQQRAAEKALKQDKKPPKEQASDAAH
ncbi:TPA: hypothetical protein N0F65_003566 [Lagenidium giganteum]|uniref:Uncharacterized protein n=1 Tax=Lagenidium giganteum TaxID=4803 RepID=A0AAV2Z1T6_9STRA|nr:TPA: hypothetical protein N0F65_003566 [Lagenidium giganteum]